MSVYFDFVELGWVDCINFRVKMIPLINQSTKVKRSTQSTRPRAVVELSDN